jgi:hypothetical protein
MKRKVGEDAIYKEKLCNKCRQEYNRNYSRKANERINADLMENDESRLFNPVITRAWR